MGFFGKKKEKVVDWSEGYRAPRRRTASSSNSQTNDSVADLGFLGNMASSNASTSSDISWDNETPVQEDFREKKTKIAKRLLDMTDKIEDLSNQIYHLKQRMEVIERKLKISFE